jgi:hypothetical protein
MKLIGLGSQKGVSQMKKEEKGTKQDGKVSKTKRDIHTDLQGNYWGSDFDRKREEREKEKKKGAK